MLIDAHAHLDRLADVDRAVAAARAAGVERIVAVGMDLPANRRVMELARRFQGTVFAAVGYHPWEIREAEVDATIDFVGARLDRCIALGEVGLDYRVKVKKSLQQAVFARVLELARENGKPAIVHSRFSHQRCFHMVAAAGVAKAVFHWYSGPLDLLEQILAAGYFVSATPALAYSPPHQAAMRLAPPERILIETDTPVAYQGRASEPAHLLDTLREMSRVKGLPQDELARVTTQNARRFFGFCSAGRPAAEAP